MKKGNRRRTKGVLRRRFGRIKRERVAARRKIGGRKREKIDHELQQFVDNLPQFAWSAGPEGTVDYVNRRSREFAGLYRRPDGSWEWYPLVHPDDREATVSAWNAALRSGEPYEVEHRLKCADGSFSWHLSRAMPVRDGAGRVSRWFGTATDIDAMKEGERARRESDSQYRAFFDNAAAGMVELDLEGRFLRANQTFCRISGYTRDELQHISMSELTHPEDRERDKREFTFFVRGEKPTYEIEKRYRRKDGGTAWIQVSAGMIEPAENRPRRLAAVVRDITRQKEAEASRLAAERALEETERRLKLALDASRVGCWDMDLRERSAWRTPRHDQIFGYDSLQSDWNYDIFMIHVLEEDRAEVDRTFREALAGKKTWSFECRIRRIDGAVRWIWVQGRVHTDEEDRPTRVYGLVSDITERKVLEENLRAARGEAEEANRAKSEFLANMSHEIRTPMTVFMSAVEHLLQIDRSPEHRPLLEMADQSADRLRKLIDDILDFSRIEARRVEIEEQPFDLRACVENAVSMMTLPARKKGLEMVIDLSPELPVLVRGDSDRLGQVLINLLSNAVKFTEAGEIKVSVHPGGDNRIEFIVSDTGIGIPVEKREQLFQSFSQLDSSFTRRFGGTGLGLAISRGLVELMGGQIGVESRTGSGSAFFFTLELPPAGEVRREAAREPQEAVESPPSDVRILVVEDEPMIRDLIVMSFARRGWKAEIAETGVQALRQWREGEYNIVLMDLQMPEMDGLEATRRIRQTENEGGRRTWIIGLTAHARSEVREQCLAIGMDQVLVKPVDMKELYRVIEDCLAA